MQRRQEAKRVVNCCFLRFCYLDFSADEELGNLVQQVAPGSGISAYLESDNELPTCYSLLNEQQLL